METIEATPVSAGRGRRSVRRTRPRPMARFEGRVVDDVAAAPVAILPPDRLTVSPLMEMFGFGETTDPPWIVIDEDPPNTEPVRPAAVTSPVAPAKSRPGGKETTRPSMFDSLPRLSDLVSPTATEPESTGTLIERMWRATDDFEPIDSWTPKSEYADRLGQSAVARWVAAGLTMLAALALVTSWIIGATATDTAGVGTRATAAVASARASVDPVRAAAVAAVDTESSGVKLNEGALALSEFDTAARRLGAVATELAGITEGAPAAGLLSRASDEGVAIERRLGATLTYRLVFDRAFVLPAMPETADLTEASDLSFELSAMVADTHRALDQLPFEPTLEPHRRQAAQALADIEVLAGLYVEALRAEQPGMASRHRQSIIDIAQAAETGLADAMPELSAELEDQIVAYESSLAEASAALAAMTATTSG